MQRENNLDADTKWEFLLAQYILKWAEWKFFSKQN